MTASRDLLCELPGYLENKDSEIEMKAPEKISDPIYEKADKLLNIDKEVLLKLTTAVEQLESILTEKKRNLFDDAKYDQLVERERKCTQIIRQGISYITSDVKKLKSLETETDSSIIRTMIHNRTTLFKHQFKELHTRYSNYQFNNKDFLPDDIFPNKQSKHEPETARPMSAEYQKLIEFEQEYEKQKNRNEEILKLAQMVTELAELFNQLNVLIEEQGELLDRIDHNIASALEHTKKGTKELVAAKKHQDKNIAAKTIIGLSVVVAGLATGLGFKRN